MNFASDVNTIFAYGDSKHKFHNKVGLHMAKNLRGKYVLLAKVKSSFIYTYKDYLVTSCIIIEKAIREYRKKLSQSPSKTYKPSHLAIGKNVHKLINDYIADMASKMDFNSNATRMFISKLLLEYSIPTLLEEEKALGEFKERYNLESEKRALEILNKFILFFRSREFELKNIEEYACYDAWFENVKSSKKSVFKNKSDREDMVIASELLAYNEEIGILGFFTCDRNMARSIREVAQEYDQRIGRVDLITA